VPNVSKRARHVEDEPIILGHLVTVCVYARGHQAREDLAAVAERCASRAANERSE
jgi:hypothetical protein